MADLSPSAKPLVFAYYVTGHGLGHATRVAEVTRHLLSDGHVVHIVSAAPSFVFWQEASSEDVRSRLHVRSVPLDCGSLQADALTVDRKASLEKYNEIAAIPRASLLKEEVEWLHSISANLVVSDIVPIACAAATQAGIPSICVSNFSWDFIYSEYVQEAGHKYQNLVFQIAEDYAQALAIIRLPGFCPMPAFRDVIDVPLVVRPVRRKREEVRSELGIDSKTKLLLFNFGGQPAGWSLKNDFLPNGWKCLVCTTKTVGNLPPNFFRPPSDSYLPDLISACDAMLGKIGYGTVSEALALKIPFIFVRRDFFNEEPFLRKMLEFYRSGVEMNKRDFLSGRWSPYLDRALKIRPCYKGSIEGGKKVAKILEEAGSGQLKISPNHKIGVGRLRDAIVFGYHMQRPPGRTDIDVPEWYTEEESHEETSPSTSPSSPEIFKELSSKERGFLDEKSGEWEILFGHHQNLPDTIEFLKTLSRLDIEGDVNASDSAAVPQIRERLAAGGLFNPKNEIIVSRAPGRLDVMGGIADYSGSLVLQMPIREACHVALQICEVEDQRLWKHSQERQKKKAQEDQKSVKRAALRIVSFGAEKSNRSPTFDMDFCDFLEEDGKTPISYEKAKNFFAEDPSQQWAAYVAGTFLVLMREKGVKFEKGINMLVSSEVPEGKGVSSSAAIEVASMSAIIGAFGIDLNPRELAICCQMVENFVVGAPCGVMDQMASACGQQNKLLAMVCQPAEIKGHVNIPRHITFWGLDSGIRHSVGGADYGSVRTGAFMGRRIIQEMAEEELKKKESGLSVSNASEEEGKYEREEALEESKLEYLANLPPHRFDMCYSSEIPEKMEGKMFLGKYGGHGDTATVIENEKIYNIQKPTSHPVYENFRVETFANVLTSENNNRQLNVLGELMLQSHGSYSKCGLGSTGTDLLVALTRQIYRQGGELFGAKITGGGCGGTVCVLGRKGNGSREDINILSKKYKNSTGYTPYVFEGSSPGAAEFGFLKIRQKKT